MRLERSLLEGFGEWFSLIRGTCRKRDLFSLHMCCNCLVTTGEAGLRRKMTYYKMEEYQKIKELRSWNHWLPLIWTSFWAGIYFIDCHFESWISAPCNWKLCFFKKERKTLLTYKKQNKVLKNHMPVGQSFTEFRFLIPTLKADNGTIHSTSNSAWCSSAIQTTGPESDRVAQCQSGGYSS